MTTPVYRSPDLPRISQTVISWLAEPRGPLAPQVAGWDDATWETARWAIQVHGIAPLLDRAAEAWPDAAMLHPHLRDYLANQRRLSAARVELLLRDLAEILAACQVAGLAVVPLKGSVLAARYYPEPGLRPMNDLDLLVRAEDEARAIAVLREVRYQPIARSWKHLMLARPEAHGTTVAFEGEHPDNPRSVDLHSQLLEQFWGIRYDLTNEAWSHVGPGELLGQAAWLLQPALLLHHLAVHTSSDMIARRVRLLHLHDIALVAAEVERAGWERMVAVARAQREERFVYPSLSLANRFFPVVPEFVLAALRQGVPPALLHYLEASGMERLSFCNSGPTALSERFCWFRPGRERASALRHMLLPDPKEIANWYPRLARPALLPLAYARYSAQMAGWGVRRALGKPRLKLFAPERRDRLAQ
jgi:hypothetical protein